MAIVTGCDLGVALCKALGLDPDVTGKITIKVVPNAIAIVEIERLITEEDSGKIALVLSEYALTSKPEPPETVAS